jgi:hypothetical protein
MPVSAAISPLSLHNPLVRTAIFCMRADYDEPCKSATVAPISASIDSEAVAIQTSELMQPPNMLNLPGQLSD